MQKEDLHPGRCLLCSACVACAPDEDCCPAGNFFDVSAMVSGPPDPLLTHNVHRCLVRDLD
eukprot:1106287-Pyramimonas_sp.AAC.1